MIFQSFSQLLQNNPSQHYSFESIAMQITPLNLFQFLPEVPHVDLEQRSAQGARFRWGKVVPAVGEWWGSTRGSPRAGSKQELEPGMVGGGASAVQQHGRRWQWRPRPRLRRGKLVMGRPREGSTGPGGLGVLGSAAQGRVRAARDEQQHAIDGMAVERARKQRERARRRRA